MDIKYKKHDQISHVLERPGMYIGPIDNKQQVRFVIQNNKAIKKKVFYNSGLEQCCLELLTNAIDHVSRTKNCDNPVTKIEINITDNYLEVKNNGQGISIKKDEKDSIWIPEMIFSNLLTSSNYDDNVERTLAGTNGIGAKAANIFSTKFIIEIVCSGKKYVQTFSNNMRTKSEPVITSVNIKDYTKIIYYPDFKKFGLKNFSNTLDDTKTNNIELITKRVYDMSAVTSKKVSIYLNGDKLDSLKDLKDYCKLYTNDKVIIYETDDGHWSIGVSNNPYDEETHISFVNGICTEDGGTHVEYILKQLKDKLIPIITKNIDVKPKMIKDNILLFIVCTIDKPEFSSQTKTKLTTLSSKFKYKCELSDNFIKNISKLELAKNILMEAKAKEIKSMEKKTSGSKTSRITGIPKLEDANLAGTKHSKECTLILVEGDSAKTSAMNGFTVVGKNKWGIFPLKGKLLNVRSATIKQLEKNEEIININKILGLSYGIKDINKLRYGHVMILTDADTDGSHIKGLLINYFTYYWPELVSQGFLSYFITPIVKVSLPGKILSFYNYNSYKDWVLKNSDKKYKTKYYKGLGTSKPEDFVNYFKSLEKNKILFDYDKKRDNENVILAFEKTESDVRKDWIAKAINNIDTIIYNGQNKVSVTDFINKELVHFSIYDCARSLPNVIDGLKISQRKILYTCISSNLYSEVKVSILSGDVSSKTEYHHGEQSLNNCIIAMAQNFVGSNNMPLLVPEGEFGSRDLGGNDSAQPRYIYTYLQKYVPIIFNKFDYNIIEYNYEDSRQVEPKFYVPIIPMVLVNGAVGIGTGWSCNIPCFNPLDIIDNLRALLNDSDMTEMVPYYKGFRGSFKKIADNKWLSQAKYKKLEPKKYYISELPVGVWYTNFKILLDTLITKNVVVEYFSNIKKVDKLTYMEYEILFAEDYEPEDVIKFLKLETHINATNMVAFDVSGVLHKYNDVFEILRYFYKYRLCVYKERKDYLLNVYKNKLEFINEKILFIKKVIDGSLVIFKVPRAIILKNMTEFKHKDLLLELKVSIFTEESIDSLEKEHKDLLIKIDSLEKTSEKQMWFHDLDLLESHIEDF